VGAPAQAPPPPPPRTKWTRRVPHPVLTGHAASLSQAAAQGSTIAAGAAVAGGRAVGAAAVEGGRTVSETARAAMPAIIAVGAVAAAADLTDLAVTSVAAGAVVTALVDLGVEEAKRDKARRDGLKAAAAAAVPSTGGGAGYLDSLPAAPLAADASLVNPGLTSAVNPDAEVPLWMASVDTAVAATSLSHAAGAAGASEAVAAAFAEPKAASPDALGAGEALPTGTYTLER